MGIFIYGLKNCDTCRKAIKALPSAQLRDVRTDGVPEAVLQQAIERFGAAVLNTRSTTWRNLTEAEREGAPLELIKQHPTLMKRPLISADDRLFLGWTKAIEADLGAIS